MDRNLKDWEAALLAFAGSLLFQLVWNHSDWRIAAELKLARAKRRQEEQEGWVHCEGLADGKAGTYQTLAWMRALVRRDAEDVVVRQYALDLVSGCRGHDFVCEIKAIFTYIRDRITYRRDPSTVERVQDTRRTLFEFRSGDCDDKSVALAALLGSLGHKSRFVVIGHDGRNFSHVYVEAWTGRRWIPLDATNERAGAGWQAQGAMREVYEIF